MEFVGLNGYVEEGSSFISLKVKDGDNSNSIGDQIWISKDGTEMHVYENADKDVLKEAMELFSTTNSRSSFKGALMRMDIYFKQ